jgi:hypothetical protein
MTTPAARRAFVYVEDLPQKGRSGANLRFWSNLHAFRDLGFEVELVDFAPGTTDPGFPGVRWTHVEAPGASPGLLSRVFYRAGFAARSACDYYFSRAPAVRREVAARVRDFPDSVHVLEGETISSSLIGLKRIRSIWSCHEVPSQCAAGVNRAIRDLQGRSLSRPEIRQERFARSLERRIAARCGLVFCISLDDAVRMQTEWNCSHAESLPTSVADSPTATPERQWLREGTLRLLHLGGLNHLPSFRSLEFLLGEVFPRVPGAVLNRIRLTVAGVCDMGSPRSRKILGLIQRYPQVSFVGYVEDLKTAYRDADLQVVVSTDACGLRTRIIESFAFGLPVLATTVASSGIDGLEADVNVIVADDAQRIADVLGALLAAPERLALLAAKGRETYETRHGRGAVAARLAELLSRHFGIQAPPSLRC